MPSKKEPTVIDYTPYKTKENTNKFKFGEVMRLEINDEHYYYIFNEESKTGQYMAGVTTVLGEAAPVTYGLREFWKNNTKEAAEELFEGAGKRGTKLHDAVEQLVLGEELNLEENYQTAFEKKAILSWMRWFRMIKLQDIMTEFVVASDKYKIAGTVDILGKASRRDAAIALNPDRYLEQVFVEGKNGAKELKVQLKQSPKFKKSWLAADIEQGVITDPDKVETWIIDNKFASDVRYSHHKQLQAYGELYAESFGEKADRLGIILPTAKNKWGFKFVEVQHNFQPFLNIYNTYVDMYDGVLPQPELQEVYPAKVKLFEAAKGDEPTTEPFVEAA